MAIRSRKCLKGGDDYGGGWGWEEQAGTSEWEILFWREPVSTSEWEEAKIRAAGKNLAKSTLPGREPVNGRTEFGGNQ